MTTGVHAGEEILLVVLGAVVIAIAATYARRRLIAKGAPLLLVAERAAGTQAWSLRLARYDSDTLDLFSLGGVSLVPKRRIGRGVGGLVSVALWRGRFAALLPVVAVWAALNQFQIRAEEAALAEAFGQEYQRYRDSVPRWL